MNLLLINPWITDFAAYDFWDRPLGLLYVAAFLERRGHSLRLLDCMDRFQDSHGHVLSDRVSAFNTGKFHREIIEKPACFSHVPRNFNRYGIPLEMFREKLAESEAPDAVLVTSIMTYWYPGVFQAIAEVKRAWPDVPVILGGIYATLCENHARTNSGADEVVIAATPEMIVQKIEDMAGKSGDGDMPSQLFGQWPDPLWNLYGSLPHAVVMSSRGCPMNCTVCASKQLFDGFERRQPDEVAASILALKERGVEDIAFADDALLLDAGNYAVPLFERLAEHGAPLRFHTPNGLHVRAIDEPLARLMKAAGLATIRLSLETASKERANDFSSKVSRRDFSEAASALFRAGFTKKEVGAYILAGLPGQGVEEVVDTIDFVHGCGVQVKPALFSPVPGTVEFDRAVETGMIGVHDDPLLQNNTLRTLDWWEESGMSYSEFRSQLTSKNLSISKA